MAKKLALLALMLVIYLAVPGQQADALKCMEQPNAEENVEHYDGVIVAQVEKITKVEHTNTLKLKVVQSFKNVQETSIKVYENADWGTSEAGESYLFYLKQDNGKWELPLCSPTKPLDKAADDLAFLQDREIPLNIDPSGPIQLLDDNIQIKSVKDMESASHLAAANSTPSGEKFSFPWKYAAIPLGIVGFAAYGVIRIRAVRRRN
ncbi:hypothetical protein D3P07_21555 [Paenibacillus sp. 1011MAR3C5]|uniref:hypothetical protein n=1 Tax=Paenibacillus sp. 1011MAR3C5 TaxID=1675787 RepID=UPI000E6C73BB|nr:hypothetical protein [Paenibacillus sp. 1011MAR3C5]RJE85158.1 hypothetical protein D3P07_21555 [Paenibacillus sp. 1011MAR3C5]